ncbi:MAG TPA: EVE domain-containing protein [Steroidobacter sp.]|jgi:predicted RNA-binding protein with PUA-like domain|nr:EVE domain-containing protein [Steroidobacter sp.]
MNYWLMKSEPAAFSIDDLARTRDGTTVWDGVRNYQARNFIRSMKKDDLVFFYHSSCEEPGIAGVATVQKEAYPDATAFDRSNDHYDSESDPSNPRWFAVDVKLVKRFERIITLEQLKSHGADELRNMVVLKRGNRLSVTPLTRAEWDFICSLASR